MAFEDEIIPATVLAFMTKSETRCYPFCQHPSCWQSLEREVRNIPRYMPPLHKFTTLQETGLPYVTVNDLLLQNRESIENKETIPRVHFTPPANYLPMLQRMREQEIFSPQNKLVREAGIYEMNQNVDPGKKTSVGARQVPLMYTWVPKKLVTHRNEETPVQMMAPQSSSIRDLTEPVLPKVFEDEHLPTSPPVTKLSKAKSPGAQKMRPLHKYDGLRDLLCLPRDVMMHILANHNAKEFKSKSRVREIMAKYGVYDTYDVEKLFKHKKLQIYENKLPGKTTMFPSTSPIFYMDDINIPMTAMAEKSWTPKHTPIECMSFSRQNTPVPINIIQDQTYPLEAKDLPEAQKEPINAKPIGLGLPTLPSGIRTTKTFSYKNQNLDLTIGPVIGAITTAVPESYTTPDQISEYFAEPPTTHRDDLSSVSPNHVPCSSPRESYGRPYSGKLPPIKGQPMVRGHKIKYSLPPSSPSTANTWPNITEDAKYVIDPKYLDQTSIRPGSATSMKSIRVKMPEVERIKSFPVPPPSPTQTSPRDQSMIAGGSDNEQVDESMIVIRQSVQSQDSLSMPPMLEEGAESDEVMSISACPPDNLDDSSVHVTPIQTSISPVNACQHWVKHTSECMKAIENIHEEYDDGMSLVDINEPEQFSMSAASEVAEFASCFVKRALTDSIQLSQKVEGSASISDEKPSFDSWEALFQARSNYDYSTLENTEETFCEKQSPLASGRYNTQFMNETNSKMTQLGHESSQEIKSKISQEIPSHVSSQDKEKEVNSKISFAKSTAESLIKMCDTKSMALQSSEEATSKKSDYHEYKEKILESSSNVTNPTNETKAKPDGFIQKKSSSYKSSDVTSREHSASELPVHSNQEFQEIAINIVNDIMETALPKGCYQKEKDSSSSGDLFTTDPLMNLVKSEEPIPKTDSATYSSVSLDMVIKGHVSRILNEVLDNNRSEEIMSISEKTSYDGLHLMIRDLVFRVVCEMTNEMQTENRTSTHDLHHGVYSRPASETISFDAETHVASDLNEISDKAIEEYILTLISGWFQTAIGVSDYMIEQLIADILSKLSETPAEEVVLDEELSLSSMTIIFKDIQSKFFRSSVSLDRVASRVAELAQIIVKRVVSVLGLTESNSDSFGVSSVAESSKDTNTQSRSITPGKTASVKESDSKIEADDDTSVHTSNTNNNAHIDPAQIDKSHSRLQCLSQSTNHIVPFNSPRDSCSDVTHTDCLEKDTIN